MGQWDIVDEPQATAAPTAAAPTATAAPGAYDIVDEPLDGPVLSAGKPEQPPAPAEPKKPSVMGDIAESIVSPAQVMWYGLGAAPAQLGGSIKDFAHAYGIKNTGKVAWAVTRQSLGMPLDDSALKQLRKDLVTSGHDLSEGSGLIENYNNWFSDRDKTIRSGAAGLAALAAGGGASRAAKPLLGKIGNLSLRKLADFEINSIAAMTAYEGVHEASPEGALKGAAMGAATGPVAFGLGEAAGPVVGAAFKAAGKVPGLVGDAANAAGRAVLPLAEKVVPTQLKKFAAASAAIKEYQGVLFDHVFKAGETVLREHGLGDVADSLIQARNETAFLTGRWTADAMESLSTLDAEDRVYAGRILEGIEPIVDVANKAKNADGVINAVGVLSKTLGEIGEQAEALGLPVYDPESKSLHRFVVRDNYLPHRIVNTQQYMDDTPVRQQVIDILKDKKGYSKARAEEWIEAFHQRNTGEIKQHLAGQADVARRSGGTAIEGRALGLPGYEPDPNKVLPQYFASMSRRIQQFKRFGALPQGMTPEGATAMTDPFSNQIPQLPMNQTGEVVTQMEKLYPRAFEKANEIAEPSRRNLAKAIIRRQLGGSDTIDPKKARLIQGLLDFETITKLGLSSISQASQFLQANVRTSFRGSFTDLVKTFSKDPEVMSRMTRAGVMLPYIIKEAESELTGAVGSKAEKVLSATGFTQLDMKARIYGALRGISHLGHQTERMMELSNRLPKATGYERKAIERELGKITERIQGLGIDPHELAANGGVLTDEHFLQAAQKASFDVNFWGDSLSLPEFYKRPWGRVLLQFKSFVAQQSKFIKDFVVKPAFEKGDVEPLARMMLAMPAGGEAIADAKWIVKGRGNPFTERKAGGLAKKLGMSNESARLADDMAQAGGFAIASDAINAYEGGLRAVMGMGIGPFFTDVAMGAYNSGRAVFGDARPLAKQAIALGAAAGPPIAPAFSSLAGNLLFPKATPSASGRRRQRHTARKARG